MSLGSIDEEILLKVHKMKITYNYLSISPRDMVLSSFYSSRYN